MRIALVGGEPLMHPDMVEIVRYCRELGFATSLTTNGFLLTRKLLQELEDAGLQVMQISVDRMTPSAITKKSFKTILPKLDYFKDSKISLHITGVICADTLPESKAVLETGLSRGIPTEVRLVHADPFSGFAWIAGAGRARTVHRFDDRTKTPWREDSHQRSDPELPAQSAPRRARRMDVQGRLQIILRFRAGKILDLQHGAHEQAHHGHHAGRPLTRIISKKSCQEGCGVYCAVSASLLVEKPVRVLGKEILARAKRVPSLLRPLSGPGINNSTPESITNPNGAREMNGSTNGGPSADNRVALGERA